MWKLLNTQYRLRVTQETTRVVLKCIDPAGVALRSRHCLQRRKYGSQGPSFIIHVDGYDILKPFGIAIHGAIDGFSRRILWLKAGPSNNNPRIVAGYYVRYLMENGRIPRLVRCDGGSENTLIMDIQVALRSYHTDNMSGRKSFSVGRSTANQRIEMLWSFLKRHFTQYWRNILKDMIDSGDFDNTDMIHLECTRFCFFLSLIQKQLDSFQMNWNIHRIRSQRHGELVSGIPEVLFQQPLVFCARDCSFSLPCDISILQDIKENYTDENRRRGCAEEFIQLVELITRRAEGLQVPASVQEAKHLHHHIINLVEQYCWISQKIFIKSKYIIVYWM